MNRIDRQNLAAMTESLNESSPIGLDTATGAPNLGERSHSPAASVPDDATVGNGGSIVAPKPGSKFAAPENFGTVPVGMDSHGDYTGPGLAPGGGSGAAQSQIIDPKPGSKFAAPENFGTVPVGMDSHGDYTGPGLAPGGGSGATQSQIIDPKPGSKFAAPEEDECGAVPEPFAPAPLEGGDPVPPEDPSPAWSASAVDAPAAGPRPAASVPDDASIPNSGETITPKPGSKFAAA